MGFTTACFIRKNTPELRKKLKELGIPHNDFDDCDRPWIAVNMTKIEHTYERIEISPGAGFCHVWKITITHNDKTYYTEISNVAYSVAYRHGDDYWNGFIYLDEYDEEGYEKIYINFNCQNVYNSLSCILIGIREIINEDFSNVDSSDFYHSNINEVISNKCDILNKISHETLFDKIIDNKRKEIRDLSKEELLKFL